MFFELESFLQYRPERPMYVLFGHPVRHSLSGEIHTFLFRQAGTDAEYAVVDCPPERLLDTVAACSDKIRGFNLTIPHKEIILPALSFIEPEAGAFGSVNTVCVCDNKLWGYNTDYLGLIKSIEAQGAPLRGAEVLILGSGGTARMAAHVCVRAGARLSIAGRTPEHVRKLADSVGAQALPLDGLAGACDILINTTPVGMYPHEDEIPADPDRLLVRRLCYDCIYNPPAPQLLAEYARRGVRTQNGLDMLVIQAAESQRHFCGSDFSETDIRDCADHAAACLFARRNGGKNIILTGFMGCGKTTVGWLLAERLRMKFMDMDAEIEREAGMPIREIFDRMGEEAFRRMELAAARALAKTEECVVAAGGGAVTRPDTAAALKSAGRIIFLDAPLDKILWNLHNRFDSRPMLDGEDPVARLTALYRQRRPVYLGTADAVADASGDPPEICSRLIQLN